jgi:hypothetical protein
MRVNRKTRGEERKSGNGILVFEAGPLTSATSQGRNHRLAKSKGGTSHMRLTGRQGSLLSE